MDSTTLKDEQYRQLLATIRRHQRFYNRLIERMNRVGFPGTDDVYLAAPRAQDLELNEILQILRIDPDRISAPSALPGSTLNTACPA